MLARSGVVRVGAYTMLISPVAIGYLREGECPVPWYPDFSYVALMPRKHPCVATCFVPFTVAREALSERTMVRAAWDTL
jgi:hypothetical protein